MIFSILVPEETFCNYRVVVVIQRGKSNNLFPFSRRSFLFLRLLGAAAHPEAALCGALYPQVRKISSIFSKQDAEFRGSDFMTLILML